MDEAHSFRAIGPNGLGVAGRFGVLDRVDAVVGTMSKVLGRLRIGMTSTHTQAECALLVERLTEARNKFSL